MNTIALLSENQTIVSLFSHQAKATPQSIAVVYQDKRYTYAEVDDISDRIAGYIASKGLESEDVVSVLIPRCEWMAIASPWYSSTIGRSASSAINNLASASFIMKFSRSFG